MARDAIQWDAPEGRGNPVVDAREGPPDEPSRFENDVELESAHDTYFGPESGREACGMVIGHWDGNNSLGWTHRRGFLVNEVHLREGEADIPFTDWEIDVLNHINCSPAQLMANGWRSLRYLQHVAWVAGVELTVRLFFYWFSVKAEKGGRVKIQRKGGRLAGFPPGPSNWKAWKDRYFPIVQNGLGRPWWVREVDNRPLFPVAWTNAVTGASPVRQEHLSDAELRADKKICSFYRRYEQTSLTTAKRRTAAQAAATQAEGAAEQAAVQAPTPPRARGPIAPPRVPTVARPSSSRPAASGGGPDARRRGPPVLALGGMYRANASAETSPTGKGKQSDKGKGKADDLPQDAPPPKKARTIDPDDLGMYIHWSPEELQLFIKNSSPDGDGPSNPRLSMAPDRIVDERGEAPFPYLPSNPNGGRFSGVASIQSLYSSGTYEWHDHLVADAFKRPPAEYAAAHAIVAAAAAHASQSLTHNLAREVAHLRAEAKTAGNVEARKALEAARDQAIADAQAQRALVKKLEEEKKKEREKRKRSEQEAAAQREKAAAARKELEEYRAGEQRRLDRAARDERSIWYWFYGVASSRGFENCRKQLSFLNPGLNEVGIDYTYELLPDGQGGLEIRPRADDDEPASPLPPIPEDWTIHMYEVAEGRSALRPGDEGYVPPADVQSTAGNQADVEHAVVAEDSAEGEGSGDHAPAAGDATLILDD